MSGVGGGGAMVLYRARDDRYEVIDYGMRAPGGLRPEDYPLTRDGAASDIFPWPRVIDDRNLHGPGSIAVPGAYPGGRVYVTPELTCGPTLGHVLRLLQEACSPGAADRMQRLGRSANCHQNNDTNSNSESSESSHARIETR